MNEFLNYNQSLLVKSLDFDKPCIKWCWDISWDQNTQKKVTSHWAVLNPKNHNSLESRVSIPMKSQFFRWAAEDYGFFHQIIPIFLGEVYHKTYFKFIIKTYWADFESENFDSGIEAENACIDKIIEYLSNPISKNKLKNEKKC